MRANKNGVNKDQKDKVKKDGYNRGQHCIYCLTYHMIFVTHYRKPVINDEMSAAMKEFSNHWRPGTDPRDSSHIYLRPPPIPSVWSQDSSKRCASVPEQIKQYIYGAIPFWSRSSYRNYRKCFS